MGNYILRLFGRHLALSAALLAMWFLLSGFFDEPTLVTYGFLSVLLTVYLSDRAGVMDEEGVPINATFGVIGFWFWLAFEVGKANLAVAREVLRPTLMLSPKMIRVPAHQKKALWKTTFANSVTLTPGTVTVDVDHNHLLIHALTEELADEQGIADMGARVSKLDSMQTSNTKGRV